jgi:uncharacterized protein with ParB-like and HNH nuclease domain
MPYQAPITVKTALDRIWKHDYVLPAIQREFVWKPEQIYRLFDSLMQGFPVGSGPFLEDRVRHIEKLSILRFLPRIPRARQSALPSSW